MIRLLSVHEHSSTIYNIFPERIIYCYSSHRIGVKTKQHSDTEELPDFIKRVKSVSTNINTYLMVSRYYDRLRLSMNAEAYAEYVDCSVNSLGDSVLRLMNEVNGYQLNIEQTYNINLQNFNDEYKVRIVLHNITQSEFFIRTELIVCFAVIDKILDRIYNSDLNTHGLTTLILASRNPIPLRFNETHFESLKLLCEAFEEYANKRYGIPFEDIIKFNPVRKKLDKWQSLNGTN